MLGRAVGTYLRRHGGDQVNLGRDCRLSSERLRNALVCGLKASGCHVTDIGVAPTPLLYYSVFHLQADAGMMITGSHNPPEYNGFKIVCGSVHHSWRRDPGDPPHHRAPRLPHRRGQRTRRRRGPSRMSNEIASQFHFARRIKVVIDAGNGTGGPVMHRLLEKLNCDATELFFEMDGHFPNHHPDPTVVENLSSLSEAVRAARRRPRYRLRWRHRPHRRGRRERQRGLRRPADDRLRARDPQPQARRDLHRRSEMLAIAVRRHSPARRQSHHVEDRPFAHQRRR